MPWGQKVMVPQCRWGGLHPPHIPPGVVVRAGGEERANKCDKGSQVGLSEGPPGELSGPHLARARPCVLPATVVINIVENVVRLFFPKKLIFRTNSYLSLNSLHCSFEVVVNRYRLMLQKSLETAAQKPQAPSSRSHSIQALAGAS